MVVSSAASSGQSSSGLIPLACGLFASVIGLGILTDFHGFADEFVRGSYASTAGLRRVPPWKWMPRKSDEEELANRVKQVRLIAIPFAIAGPILIVVGVVQIARGHFAVPRGPAAPLPVVFMFVGFVLVGMFQYWRRGGLLRLAAGRGGWRRGAAITASLGALSFAVFTALGFTTLGIAGWLVGGLSSLSLVTSLREPAPTTQVNAPSLPPPKPAPPSDPEEAADDAAFRWL